MVNYGKAYKVCVCVKNMVKEKIKKEICNHCGGVIFIDKDKYVILQTNRGNEIMEQNYYHFKCWQGFWNEKIQQAILKRARVGMEGLRKITNQLQGQLQKQNG